MRGADLALVLAAAIVAPTAAAQTVEPPAVPVPQFQHLVTPPPGLPPMPLPEGAAPTEAMFELGRKLFADALLSRDRTISCAHCHKQEHGFAGDTPLAIGIEGRMGKRNAPALLNRAWGKSLRWDGSVDTIEHFVLQPIVDKDEMDLPVATALQRLAADAGYQQAFAKAFPDGVTADNLSTALATFVRGIVAPVAAYDLFHQGKVQEMSADARAGMWIFESKGACWRCHTPGLFTDEAFHNTGVGVHDGKAEPGRAAHSRDEADRGRFKTPTLRGLRLTAPYMHDGSLPTLVDVVEFYDRGGNRNPGLDPRLQPLHLTPAEKQQLIAFLASL
jgi:cytochrome c peroxidase